MSSVHILIPGGRTRVSFDHPLMINTLQSEISECTKTIKTKFSLRHYFIQDHQIIIIFYIESDLKYKNAHTRAYLYLPTIHTCACNFLIMICHLLRVEYRRIRTRTTSPLISVVNHIDQLLTGDCICHIHLQINFRLCVKICETVYCVRPSLCIVFFLYSNIPKTSLIPYFSSL